MGQDLQPHGARLPRDVRRDLVKRLDQEAERSSRNGTHHAFLQIEVDAARGVDASRADGIMGPLQGRLEGRLRRYDHVARMNESALGVVLSDVKGGPNAVAILADRLQEMLSLPVPTAGGDVLPKVRMGIATGEPGLSGMEMLRRAAVALARGHDEGIPVNYDVALDERMRDRRRFHDDLRTAIAEGGVQVAYQPLYDPDGERVVGVEALARWTHRGRQVPPPEFITHAEETGLIAGLGEHVLRRACADGARWPGITVAVNVSPLQLADPLFPAMVEEVLAETGLEPDRLEIEITEGIFVSEPETVVARLGALRSVGVRIALDDFGTGYSSLGYLRTFPLDRVKIDRSFVADGGAQAQAIVSAVLGLARALGMETTAEGVETEAQRVFLAERGCERMQGYLLGRPVPAESIDDLVDLPRGPSP